MEDVFNHFSLTMLSHGEIVAEDNIMPSKLLEHCNLIFRILLDFYKFRMVLSRYYDLIAIDEVGYVPLAEVGAEFLFQVIAERAERTAVVLTTNLPFSEWTQVIPNARLCKALLDRITDRAHILETGTESYRFRRTLDRQKKGAKTADK